MPKLKTTSHLCVGQVWRKHKGAENHSLRNPIISGHIYERNKWDPQMPPPPRSGPHTDLPCVPLCQHFAGSSLLRRSSGLFEAPFNDKAQFRTALLSEFTKGKGNYR